MAEYLRPEIIPEDDDLVGVDILEQMEDTSIFSWLKEDLTEAEFNSLQPTQVVFGMIENEHAEDLVEKHPRPFVCLYKVGSDCMIGFQITSSNSSPLCKYPLKDWQSYSLRKPSFVNIHHIVKVYRRELKFTHAQNLSEQDVRGLVEFMYKLDRHNKITGYSPAYNIKAEADYLANKI